MEHIISTSLLSATMLAPVISGLCEVVKSAGVPKKLIPATAVIMSVLIYWSLAEFQFSGLVLFEGVITALISTGLYSGVKNSIEGIKLLRNKIKK